jgi:hypothetical protein
MRVSGALTPWTGAGYVVLSGRPRLLAGLVFFGFCQCYETVKQARAHGDSDDRNRTVRRYATNRYGYHMDVPHG